MIQADLRSDTVTRPSREMLECMMRAETGDDVFGEDPTVKALEVRLANMFGKEAGLFCPSGTMSNQIAIQVHTRPGDEVICSELAHIYLYEGGGMAKNSGVSVRLLNGDKGRINASDVALAINPPDSHYARTRLVSIEDTCNKGGGSCYDPSEVSRISALCREKGLGFHLDGARVFNALIHRNQRAEEYGIHFDSISVCLSKGLGTPAGSVLLGSREFIKEAHRSRKSMGGGMRQVGILAAAGLFALDHNLSLLRNDHENASKLARSIAQNPSVESVIEPETNIVIFRLSASVTSAEFVSRLSAAGIAALPFGPDKVRFVSHLDLSDKAIAYCEAMLPLV